MRERERESQVWMRDAASGAQWDEQRGIESPACGPRGDSLGAFPPRAPTHTVVFCLQPVELRRAL